MLYLVLIWHNSKSLMNQFSERYKSLYNSDLLKIINNPGDYQPLAVETAKIELNTRQLTAEELEIANKEYESQQVKEQARIEKQHALENISKRTLFSMLEIIKRPPPKRRIKIIISMIFILMLLFQAIGKISLVSYMFTDDGAGWDLAMVILLLPLLLIPISLLLFWFNKKTGWVLLSVYIIYLACYSIIEFYELFSVQYPEDAPIHRSYSPMSFFPFLFFQIFFFGGMIWAMCRNDIRQDYRIDKKTLFISIGFALCLAAVLFFSHQLA